MTYKDSYEKADEDDERSDVTDAEGPSEEDLAAYGEGSDEPSETVACPHCGREIYEDSDRCPHCGMNVVFGRDPAKSRRWAWWIVLAAILTAIAVGAWQAGIVGW